MKNSRVKSRKKKRPPYILLFAVITVVTATIFTIAHEDIKGGIAAFISTSKSLFSQDADQEQIVSFFDNTAAHDISEPDLFEPVKVLTSFNINSKDPEDNKDIIKIKYELSETLIETESYEKGSETGKLIIPKKDNKIIQIANKWRGETFDDSQSPSQLIATQETKNIFKIARLVIAENIDDRKPVGVNNVFSSLSEKVYCFLEARDISEDTVVSFVWYHEGNEMATVELPIYKGSRWRTHSSKKLGGLTGEWEVALQDFDGNVLESATFFVD